MTEKWYLSDVMDSLGVSKFTIRVLLLVGIAMVFDGFDYMIVSYTMPQISAEWGLSGVQMGGLSSWSLLGLVLGGIVSGVFADKFGRKKVLLWGTVCYSILSILIFFAPNYTVFSVLRVLTGFGLGACIPMANTLNSEYAPSAYRGLFIAVGMAFMILGWVLAGIFAILIIPTFGWRIVYLLGGIPIIYVLVCRFALPESAMWLISQGRKDEALQIIREMEASADKKIGVERSEDIAVPVKPEKVGVLALFSKSFVFGTICMWVAGFCIAAVMYGINAWTPSMLIMIGYDTTASYSFTICQNILAAVGNVCAGLMLEKFGRVRGTAIAFAVSAAALVFMSFALGGGRRSYFHRMSFDGLFR